MIIDKGFQDKVLSCLINKRDFCLVACKHLKSSYFDGDIQQNISKITIDFFNRYDTTITNTAFVQIIANLVKEKIISADNIVPYTNEYNRIRKMPVHEYNYILDNLIIFLKNREIKIFLEDTVKKHLKKNDFKSMEKQWSDIVAININPEVDGYSYYDNIKERVDRREEEKKIGTIGITTGINEMDNNLHKKGWYPKELYIICAPPKTGKSQSLIWFSNIAAKNGYNSAHFTLEVSKEIVSDRLDAMNSDIEVNNLISENLKITGRISVPVGDVIIFEYPTKTITTNDVERKIKEWEQKSGKRIHMLVIDYADLLLPTRYNDDDLVEQSSIFVDLRGLATKMHLPVITASQINRQGAGKSKTAGKDVAGTYGKVMVADEIITLSASREELELNRLRINFAESRNSPAKTLKITTAYQFGKFFNDFLGEE